SPRWLLVGLVVGLAAGASAGLRRAPRLRAVGIRVGVVVAAMLLGAAALEVGSSGYVARHALVRSEFDAPAAAILSRLPSFTRGDRPVAAAPVALGLLAGDSLRHQLALIGEREP